ncbi:hypothetical protein EI42_05941 [Thermosporothrix hazakensis]|jgi:hypothetical protein|uniref:Uncharacterized protein n=1 Tax=Thermosporothrix hazakensis TaxID=644383 RepID=A0A326TT10_THEHA|nr:hypothetical protein [Thermosporothrix hazakensis]PZW19713.1 hypothetical protein EI42_05941 [Thermosporothrix hazakensis]
MSISDQRWPIEGQPTLFLHTWTEADFSAVQRLSVQQGWLTSACGP